MLLARRNGRSGRDGRLSRPLKIDMDGDDTPRSRRAAREADEKRRTAERRHQARASAIGFQFVLSIAVGAWGGNWLDERFDTTPLLLIAGLLLGAAAAYRDLAKLARDNDALDATEPDPSNDESST